MHIMEGYLDPLWCVVWFVVMAPFFIAGVIKLRKILAEHPEQKMTVALSGAFIFLLSSLKLPSVTGSCSHPTGTGIAVVFYGVGVCAVLSTIVLVFQALLLAHGGFTTLGANCVSMGIIGPLCGLLLWRVCRGAGAGAFVSMFVAAFIADLMTYVVTAFQMALNIMTAGDGNFVDALIDFLSIYAVTQIPLAIVEGIVLGMFAHYLFTSRPEIFEITESNKLNPLSTEA
ncbi:MAG: cobalt ECF transporter S component CbiM [Candidatus Methanomethylophilaceae archaeon]|nr:cobalt ECF transporter S component CbiM [Candidatus Methanomethylophilaceae archaeon]MBQ9689167.1 cobalt ECF transporter S component CbiM [Candidatus Methanomethylophilaceae archaeon]